MHEHRLKILEKKLIAYKKTKLSYQVSLKKAIKVLNVYFTINFIWLLIVPVPTVSIYKPGFIIAILDLIVMKLQHSVTHF